MSGETQPLPQWSATPPRPPRHPIPDISGVSRPQAPRDIQCLPQLEILPPVHSIPGFSPDYLPPIAHDLLPQAALTPDRRYDMSVRNMHQPGLLTREILRADCPSGFHPGGHGANAATFRDTYALGAGTRHSAQHAHGSMSLPGFPEGVSQPRAQSMYVNQQNHSPISSPSYMQASAALPPIRARATADKAHPRSPHSRFSPYQSYLRYPGVPPAQMPTSDNRRSAASPLLPSLSPQRTTCSSSAAPRHSPKVAIQLGNTLGRPLPFPRALDCDICKSLSANN